MRETAVMDASAVIVLAKCEMLWLVELVAKDRVITPAVAREILAGAGEDRAVDLVRAGSIVQTPPVQISAAVAAHELDPGEAEVISCTLDHPAERMAILDDRPARQCAAALSAPHVGAVGLAVEAARRSKLTDLPAVLVQFQRSGLYISRRLMEEALRLGSE